MTENVRILLPKKGSIKRTLRRAREKNEDRDTEIPTDLADFIVPEELQITASKKRFLQYDSGTDDPKRIIIFLTRYALKALSRLEHWFGDGTFDLCPHWFKQIYTIDALYEGKSISLVYALLPAKDETTYKRLLQILKSLRPKMNPSSMMMDLEIAASNAFRTKFPNARVRYCFFHVEQALYRNLASRGLKARYAEDDQFNLKIKTLPALGFVPVKEVEENFERVVGEKFADEQEAGINEFLSYFQENYIGMKICNRHKPPRFPIEM